MSVVVDGIHPRGIVRRAASQPREEAAPNEHAHIPGEACEEGTDAVVALQQHAADMICQ